MSDSNPLTEPSSESYSQAHIVSPARVADQNAVRRPSGVTAFAIIGMLLGGMKVLGSGFGVLVKVFGINFNQSGPIADLESIMLYRVFQYVNFAVSLLLGLALVVIAFRLLKMSDWARKMIGRLAIAEIIWVLAFFALNAVLLTPRLSQNAGELESVVTAVIVLFALLLGLIFAMIYPIAALWYFRKKSVKEAFANWEDDS